MHFQNPHLPKSPKKYRFLGVGPTEKRPIHIIKKSKMNLAIFRANNGPTLTTAYTFFSFPRLDNDNDEFEYFLNHVA